MKTLHRVMSGILVGMLGFAMLSTIVGAEPSVSVTVDLTAAADTTTAPPTVVGINATGITSTTATVGGNITETGGGNSHTIGFDWGLASGNYTETWSTTGTFGLGVFDHEITDLPINTDVYWRAFAINSVGRGNSTEHQFTTLIALPLAPTDFTAIQSGADKATLTWTMGAGAATTMIRVSETGSPRTVVSGYQVYNAGSTSVEVDGLNFQTTQYSFSAWSENSEGYSEDYAEAKIGGSMLMMGFFGFLGLGLIGLFLWKRIAFLAYAAAGVWALMGFQSFQSSAGTNPTQIVDTYMALFWLAISLVLACVLIPALMREKPEPGDMYADDVGDDVSSFFPEKKATTRAKRSLMSEFSRTGAR